MPVYVDNARIPYRGMRMNHMVADTTDELLEMCHKIGVHVKWIQKVGTHEEHFDVAANKRLMAIQLGAKAVPSEEIVRIMDAKRDHPYRNLEPPKRD